MEEISMMVSKDKLQLLVYLGIAALAGVLVAGLFFTDEMLFQRFIGGINPLLAWLILSVLGALLFTLLLSRGWLAVFKPGSLPGSLRYSGLAALFLVVSLVVDIKVGFPADMNVLFPKSLLFYPAIAFFVEILFHVLPLAVLMLFLTVVFKNASLSSLLWVAMIAVALLEPTYQVLLMVSSSRFPPWAVVLVWLNLFAFNYSQLLLFKRFDFVSMLSFRLVYYALWHILWGYLRLRLLY